MIYWVYLLSLLLLCTVLVELDASSQKSEPRRLEFINESGDNIDLDWVRPDNGQVEVFEQNLTPGERVEVESFSNQTFLIRYHRDADPTTDGSCSERGCGAGAGAAPTLVTVSDRDDQVIIVKKGLEVTVADLSHAEKEMSLGRLESAEIIRACREQAMMKTRPSQALQALEECLDEKITATFAKKMSVIAGQFEARIQMADWTENYTCADTGQSTSTTTDIRPWTHDGVTRQAHILHDRRSSQIHLIPNFISREECDAVKTIAAPYLSRGEVSDGKGGTRVSEHRKAWQAGVKVDWTDADDPITRLGQRVFDYTQDAVGFNMTVVGQEELMSIQYFGNGPKDSRPDHYKPHCDGDCGGGPHSPGGRVATMIMYCDAPAVGGGTNFQNSNIFIKPEVGTAVFFSYLDPDTMIHDDGFTLHSGCPVITGSKRIVVQWMRIGVNEDNPWNSFDSNNVKITEPRVDEEDNVEVDIPR